jgi:hypothetical protein
MQLFMDLVKLFHRQYSVSKISRYILPAKAMLEDMFPILPMQCWIKKIQLISTFQVMETGHFNAPKDC